jgi:hypothetical protein
MSRTAIRGSGNRASICPHVWRAAERRGPEGSLGVAEVAIAARRACIVAREGPSAFPTRGPEFLRLIWPILVKRGKGRPCDFTHSSFPRCCGVVTHRMGNATRGSFEATMDHTDIRGLDTALHCSVAGLPRSSVGDHPEGCPHSRAEGSPHRVSRIALPIRCDALVNS